MVDIFGDVSLIRISAELSILLGVFGPIIHPVLAPIIVEHVFMHGRWSRLIVDIRRTMAQEQLGNATINIYPRV